jgi:hypothetical protein
MSTYENTYPVRFSVDYPDRPLNRVTTAFRIFVAIPIAVVLTSVSGGVWEWSQGSGKSSVAGAGGLFMAIPHFIVIAFLDLAAVVAVIVAWFAILFTGRYPEGIFDFVQGVIRWNNRVIGYAVTLVTDRYPPFSLAP